MKHPSIRLRLIAGSTLLASLVLSFGAVVIYRQIRTSLLQGIDTRLHDEAALLSKAVELIPSGIMHKWRQTSSGADGLTINGLFQFWEQRSGKITRSPDLGERDIPFFHGRFLEFVTKNVTLSDGTPARATALLHHPRPSGTLREQRRIHGESSFQPEDYPLVVVVAVPTREMEAQLATTRTALFTLSLLAVLAIWIAIFLISKWSLRPIDNLALTLARRSTEARGPLSEIPDDLPRELVGLTEAFNENLRQLELARQHEKEFAFSAAHELRTPVAGIQGVLEQALFRPRDAETLRDRMNVALGLTHRVRETIGSLMRLARLRGGIEQLSPEPFSPETLIREIIAQHNTPATRDIVFDPASSPGEITGDPGLFAIVAGNLIDNALGHSPEGSTVHIRTGTTGQTFTLSVTNPRGTFDPADAERIFRPFERGSQTSVDSPGAGLGLSLAKEIATCLKGTLSLAFDTPDSLTFRLVLPTALKR